MDEQRLRDILGQTLEVPDMVNKKLEETYARLEGRQPPAKHRTPRPLRTALIAAALAAVGLLCIAAGLPYQVYNFFSGGTMTVMPAGNGMIGGGSMTVAGIDDSPLILEDGRLWFVNGKERTDITDLIDEDTPYIYEHTDPTTQNKGYVIMGGTVDNFGWAEYASLGGNSGMTGINFAQHYVILDGERFSSSELTDEQLARIQELTATPPEDRMDQPCPLDYEDIYAPWLITAMEQLGIESRRY